MILRDRAERLSTSTPGSATLLVVHDHADSWGALIRDRRRVLGLRQEELAALAGVGVRSVHVVETSKPTVRLDVLLAVVEALGLTLTLGRGDEVLEVRSTP